MMKKTLNLNLLLGGLALAAATGSAQAGAQPVCGLNNGQPAAGAPIPVGAVVGKTGPDDFSTSSSASQAYFDCVNANGGIHGRPILYRVADDQWNPEVAAQVAAKLVKDEKVVALAGNASFVECGANAKMYEQEGVMAIAGGGVQRECFFGRNYVPVNAGPRISGANITAYAAEKYKARKIVCIIPNIPGLGDWACEGAAGWSHENGIEFDTITFDPGSADATSTILRAVAKQPEIIVLNVPKGLLLALASAAEQQNLIDKIHFVAPTPAYSVDVPDALGPAWDGKLEINLEFNPIESAGPDNTNWKAVMDRYADKDVARDSFAQGGYLAARLLTDTLLKMDPARIDRASVTAALRQVRDFESDILCKPFYVGDGPRHNANTKGPTMVIRGEGFAQVGECMSARDPELRDIRVYERDHKL